jgi:hypothetical protein
MTAEVDVTRKAVGITWDAEIVQGDKADIRCVNPANDDVSTIDGAKNDGAHVITFPADYSGECNVTVTGSDGGEDTGTITVN